MSKLIETLYVYTRWPNVKVTYGETDISDQKCLCCVWTEAKCERKQRVWSFLGQDEMSLLYRLSEDDSLPPEQSDFNMNLQ